MSFLIPSNRPKDDLLFPGYDINREFGGMRDPHDIAGFRAQRDAIEAERQRVLRAEHPMTRFEQARAAQQDAVARFLAGGNAADRLRLQIADAELAKTERQVRG